LEQSRPPTVHVSKDRPIYQLAPIQTMIYRVNKDGHFGQAKDFSLVS